MSLASLSGGTNLFKMLNQIMDLTKISAGRYDLQKTPVDAGGMLWLARENFVARPAMRQDRDLVAHRAGGQENRRLLTKQRRHAIAEFQDSRIVAVLLVADLGREHRRFHPG